MTRRVVEEEGARTLLKMRRSYYVSLPIRIVREFGWQVGQKVLVEERGKEMVIKDWKSSKY